MEISFTNAMTVGKPADLVPSVKMYGLTTPSLPQSDRPRGLVIKSLTITSQWDSLWNFINKVHHIYFLCIAFDFSGADPIIYPPKTVTANAIIQVPPGKTISFTLGEGLPLFPSREIIGGLVIYICVVESNKSIAHIGEVMAQVHEDLTKEGSLADILKQLISNPTAKIADEVIGAATAALQPIATILKNDNDNYFALFNGIYDAKGPWKGKLQQTQNGTKIVLKEI